MGRDFDFDVYIEQDVYFSGYKKAAGKEFMQLLWGHKNYLRDIMNVRNKICLLAGNILDPEASKLRFCSFQPRNYYTTDLMNI